jgi:hypothetical protein
MRRQQESGREETLTGPPRDLHAFRKKHPEPRGYHIKFRIADWPDGMPVTSA